MENVRYNISPCSADEANAFISKIDTGTFVPNGTVKADGRSHYDRYSFLREDNRVAVVYDTSASIISITGRQDHAKDLLDVFDVKNKTVKQSTVPAQQSSAAVKPTRSEPVKPQIIKPVPVGGSEPGTRAKLFVPPERIIRSNAAPVHTVIATKRGFELSTDEIYPPQIVKRREPQDKPKATASEHAVRSEVKATAGEIGEQNNGVRRTVISFGEAEEDVKTKPAGEMRGGTGTFGSAFFGGYEEEKAPVAPPPQPVKRKRGRPPKNAQAAPQAAAVAAEDIPVRRRGRPRKMDKAQNDYVSVDTQAVAPEYKNGYSVKNYPPDALSGALKRLRADGKAVSTESTEFAGTVQEVRVYSVTDIAGQRVLLRYATNRKTLQMQGKRSDLFGEVQSQISRDSDYSSALEGYVESSGKSAAAPGERVSYVQTRLKKRLPTAYGYLSEQSRIDFSYGIHDFGMSDLRLSDYSVLLVPAFRGLERYIFDIQRAKGIRVKMIGQAFDKDVSGRYILKSGYMQRIGSVVYAEVLVALYNEYFSRRNFFAHSDNTDAGGSRSLPDKAAAKAIFDNLLDIVEYNSKKLKEIGFSITADCSPAQE